MSRILLTWELGLNLGHLGRLLPVATELGLRDHAVVVAARDLSAAAYVLAPGGISFVQAPHLTHGNPLPHRPAGYSDILRAQGWGDRTTLRGLVEGWINLFRLFRPDLIVADYSPTAVLAARLVGLPYLLIGNGFEIPPATEPLPPFPGFSWATAERAAASEKLVVANAAGVAQSLRRRAIASLRELFNPAYALFATFPELDHYGTRAHTRYVGTLLGKLQTQTITWPTECEHRKVFVCVRPDTQHVGMILESLRFIDASIVCVALGFGPKQLDPFRADHVVFSTQPVDLAPIARAADVCISYGAEGTVASFLLAGVPQVLAPLQVEAYMASRRIEALGLGLLLSDEPSTQGVVRSIETAIASAALRESARRFMKQHASFDPAHTIAESADEIERAAGSSWLNLHRGVSGSAHGVPQGV
jgi:UDP:flavonoid glycosyltransferase YjiC (YdhE family)